MHIMDLHLFIIRFQQCKGKSNEVRQAVFSCLPLESYETGRSTACYHHLLLPLSSSPLSHILYMIPFLWCQIGFCCVWQGALWTPKGFFPCVSVCACSHCAHVSAPVPVQWQRVHASETIVCESERCARWPPVPCSWFNTCCLGKVTQCLKAALQRSHWGWCVWPVVYISKTNNLKAYTNFSNWLSMCI